MPIAKSLSLVPQIVITEDFRVQLDHRYLIAVISVYFHPQLIQLGMFIFSI